MTQETDALATDLKAVATEIWPYRPIAHLRFSDEILVLGVLLRREMVIRKLKPGYAEVAEPGPTARQCGKREPVE